MSIAARFRASLTQAATMTARHDLRWAGGLMAMAVTGAMAGLLVDATAQVRTHVRAAAAEVATAVVTPLSGPVQPVIEGWDGKDIDGDGADDFVNPTGQDVRAEDDFGYGHYGASRDGGTRDHAGVDFIAKAGQAVLAPISGYVTKIGFAYGGDDSLRYVEIRNPALRYEARVFYVDPTVGVGDSVHLGDTIGTMHTLQDKYGEGMTNHVHLELSGPGGARFDATQVLTARYAKPLRRALG
jgi:murein DD-endopeptidase MepM/ murein hydrolase activator NlpD